MRKTGYRSWIGYGFLIVLVVGAFRYGDQIQQWVDYRTFSAKCPGDRYQRYEHFNTHIPKGFTVHGIDVSHFCCEIDWKKISEVFLDSIQVQFAFMRATMGDTGKDFQFRRNWKLARQHGVLRGAYHYYYPDKTPEAQAAHFLRTVSIEPGDLPPVLDIETTDGSTLPELLRDLRIWLEMVENSTGVKPILYTNVYHLARYFNGRLKDYPLWIAQYDGDTLSLPDDRSWLFWQHSNTGRIDGCSQPVDMNVFNGTLTELQQFCK